MIRALLIVAALAAPAHASDSCSDLATPKKFLELPEDARKRFASGAQWEARRDFKPIVVNIYMKRAPHIAKDIVTSCASGIKIDRADPADLRRLTSHLVVHVTSWAALARIAQLPAVTTMSAFDSTMQLRKHFRDIRDIEDIDF